MHYPNDKVCVTLPESIESNCVEVIFCTLVCGCTLDCFCTNTFESMEDIVIVSFFNFEEPACELTFFSSGTGDRDKVVNDC